MRIARVDVSSELFYAIAEGESLVRLKGLPYEEIVRDGRTYKLAEAKLLAPAEPTKVVCMGKNYLEHALELNEGVPEIPGVFIKPTTSVNDPEGELVYPAISHRVDYEGELAIVIGKKAKHVAEAEALDYVFGYTCLNDVTARDVQKNELQWTRGKAFDTFCPFGPWVETEFDPSDAHLETRVNGKVVQSDSTAKLMHGVAWIISYLTECMTLLPGDIVATGTPKGIGAMQRGDTVEVEIEGIGVLRNRLV